MPFMRRADIFRFVHHSDDGRRWTVVDTETGLECGSFGTSAEAIAAALSANREHSIWKLPERPAQTFHLI